jgi:2-polyprenyl-3-methyl-5-hydroxy-6-metoxy-1,4-benzoquinol methylase
VRREEQVAGLATKIKRRLLYNLFLAPRGYGFPVEREIWEQQYREGVWDYLNSTDELAHYMVIVGYVYQLSKAIKHSPSVLDLGCGHGRLLELLAHLDFKSYMGVDLSAAALKQAESLGVERAAFEATDFEQWNFVAGSYDIIILNESLYYAKDPAAMLSRYRDALSPEGVFIVSLNRYGNYAAIWKNIGQFLSVIASTAVENIKGQVWDVKLLSPSLPAES